MHSFTYAFRTAFSLVCSFDYTSHQESERDFIGAGSFLLPLSILGGGAVTVFAYMADYFNLSFWLTAALTISFFFLLLAPQARHILEKGGLLTLAGILIVYASLAQIASEGSFYAIFFSLGSGGFALWASMRFGKASTKSHICHELCEGEAGGGWGVVGLMLSYTALFLPGLVLYGMGGLILTTLSCIVGAVTAHLFSSRQGVSAQSLTYSWAVTVIITLLLILVGTSLS